MFLVRCCQQKVRKILKAIACPPLSAINEVEKAIRHFFQAQVFLNARRTTFIMFRRMQRTVEICAGTKRTEIFHVFLLSVIFHVGIKNANDVFSDGTVLVFTAATNADAANDGTVREKWITASDEGDAWIVGLYGHEGTTFGCSTGNIFGGALSNRSGVCFARHECCAQHKRITVAAKGAGQTTGIIDGKTDVNAEIAAFFTRRITKGVTQSIC